MKKKLTLIITISILVSLIACGNSKSNGRYFTHRIRRGDTLYSLSRRYKTKVKTIMRVNRIYNPSNLKIGQRIRIPRNNVNSIRRSRYRRNNSVRHRYAYDRRYVRFIYPVRGRLLSPYGWRRTPFRRRASFHTGIDLKGRIGTPIRASASGIVSFSGWKRGYGRVVIIKHAGNFSTVYAHNHRNLVRRRYRVKQGQLIAYVGMSGRTTGSHVHFEIRYRGRHRNPIKYLSSNVTFYQ